MSGSAWLMASLHCMLLHCCTISMEHFHIELPRMGIPYIQARRQKIFQGGAQKSILKIFTSHHFNLIFRRSSANLSTFKEISNVHFAKFLPSRLQNTRYVVHTAVKTTSQYGIWAIGRMRWVAVRATPVSRSISRCNSAQRTLCVADRGDFSSNICENPNISISTSIFQGSARPPPAGLCRRPCTRYEFIAR